MNKEPIKLDVAYKVVQEVNGRYWSANPSIAAVKDCIRFSKSDSSLVEYKINHQTFPYKHAPVLFVCTLAEATPMLEYFKRCVRNSNGGAGIPMKLMRGLAFNLRDYLFNDEAYGEASSVYVPLKSSVCDWFVPLEIIK